MSWRPSRLRGDKASLRRRKPFVCFWTVALLASFVAKAEAQDWQKHQLLVPAERIYPGPGTTIAAVDGEGGKIQLVNFSSGENGPWRQLDGEFVSAVPRVVHDSLDGSDEVGRDLWEYTILTKRPKEGNSADYEIKVYGATQESLRGNPKTYKFPGIYINPMAQPVFSPDGYTLAWDRPIGESKGGPYLLYSDKTEQLGQQVYTSLAPPHDFLPIRSGRLMLALFPSRQKASLIDVSIGEALDSISVFGLHFRDPTHYAVFAPDAVDGGTGDVVVANADVEALTVLSVEKDSRSTRLSAPLQITLENLPALRKGNRRVLLGANKDLSVILVGAIGDPELSVFRKSGGGLEELAPVTLPEPIQDMVVLPRQPPTGDEAVALLGSAGDRLFVLADIQELATSHTVDQQGNLITAELTRENIRLIQKVLAELGYSIGSIDGLLGPRTDAAIRAFQLANGIAVSGSVDEPTLTALNRKADSVLQP